MILAVATRNQQHHRHSLSLYRPTLTNLAVTKARTAPAMVTTNTTAIPKTTTRQRTVLNTSPVHHAGCCGESSFAYCSSYTLCRCPSAWWPTNSVRSSANNARTTIRSAPPLFLSKHWSSHRHRHRHRPIHHPLHLPRISVVSNLLCSSWMCTANLVLCLFQDRARPYPTPGQFQILTSELIKVGSGPFDWKMERQTSSHTNRDGGRFRSKERNTIGRSAGNDGRQVGSWDSIRAMYEPRRPIVCNPYTHTHTHTQHRAHVGTNHCIALHHTLCSHKHHLCSNTTGRHKRTHMQTHSKKEGLIRVLVEQV